ncbi:uncharacterized protein L969DRAFT_91434 [Mixia osmundae IAM 14324]|uniref:NUDE domain-containing protein n=1 Tax=Mixia osmundae (strain CBS 9802 / IAM 14324 / JCM 22182 / KY 12970) TaxID=764103 RepID=G7E3W1_MIXOS|nr:uncharacterized protein L969DRAFT_91434 [Mixia osmundae IAM 14324]KEI41966.1 hypothetical protein L969DRAFT_91434 [Mixia osmundae IAM 14324]GAA97521.1 hypothetical protein E5Q_04199 [Mixia osmundae IAM 14324]
MSDDDPPSFSTDAEALIWWQGRASSLQDDLDDTKLALEEFQASSGELEEELEKNLAAGEKRELDLRKTVERLKVELDQWKTRHQTTLKEHHKSLSSMKTELESVRISEDALRRKLRDLELDNDDLEKSERVLNSTLQDLEARHGKSVERITLLEQDLVSSASTQEELQRVKDELRDTLEEVAVLRGRLEAETAVVPVRSPAPPPSSAPDSDRAEVESAVAPKLALLDITPERLPSPVRTGSPRTASGLRLSQTRIPVATKHTAATQTSPLPDLTRPAPRSQKGEDLLKGMKDRTKWMRDMTAKLDSRRQMTSAIPVPKSPATTLSRASVVTGIPRLTTPRRDHSTGSANSRLSESVTPSPPQSTTGPTFEREGSGGVPDSLGDQLLRASVRTPSRHIPRPSLPAVVMPDTPTASTSQRRSQLGASTGPGFAASGSVSTPRRISTVFSRPPVADSTATGPPRPPTPGHSPTRRSMLGARKSMPATTTRKSAELPPARNFLRKHSGGAGIVPSASSRALGKPDAMAQSQAARRAGAKKRETFSFLERP